MYNIEFNKKRKYEWLIIAQSYFQNALITARILNEKLSEFFISSHISSHIKGIYGDYMQSPEYLIYPILFNFKHGIEIYLKALIGMQNYKFPKNHNLISLMKEAKIKDKKTKIIIKKYAFANLFLPRNKKKDKKNEFERYPQGTPYDKSPFIYHINKTTGKTLKPPKYKKFNNYLKWIDRNDIDIRNTITQKKINELIQDIEYVKKSLRNISFKL